MTAYDWQIVYEQKHLVCDPLISHCFLFLNVNFVVTFPADFNAGVFIVSERFFVTKANYQFGSYAIASSPMFVLALFVLMNLIFITHFNSFAGWRGSGRVRSEAVFEMDISTLHKSTLSALYLK